LFQVIPLKQIEKRYLFYFLNSPLFQNVIMQSIKGAAMPAISFGLINIVILPFPKTVSEQHAIVREIESRLSVCDKVEQSISEALEKAEALRQSILKKSI
jgi:type I restriction enzyme S subunit